MKTKTRVLATRSAFSLCLTCLVAAMTFGLLPVLGASGESAIQLHPYKIFEDRFEDYDFSEKKVSLEYVDNPIDLIFGGAANIDKVKSDMADEFPVGKKDIPVIGNLGASTAHGLIDDGEGWEWDSDAGRKTSVCEDESPTGPDVYHFRLYAPPATDHLRNPAWGNYVVGSSHIDHNECEHHLGIGEYWVGKSEKAERYIAHVCEYVFGKRHVMRYYALLGNAENGTGETGDHKAENDGYATFIQVE
jgi:hypothetical protein